MNQKQKNQNVKFMETTHHTACGVCWDWSEFKNGTELALVHTLRTATVRLYVYFTYTSQVHMLPLQ